MKSICIIIPYYGNWPRWFHFFLETCRYNRSVTWLFFTDCPTPDSIPDNVAFHHMSLCDLRSLASSQLDLAVNLEYPFKICDFRPAFGRIFREFLGDFDYWGWGDLDVFYGDLRLFMTDRVLSRYDVISSRSGFLAGELTLLRNHQEINELYRESKDYQRVFTDRRGYDFEEYGFFRDRPVDSMTHVVKRLAGQGRIRVQLRDLGRTDRRIRGRPFRFFWHGGRMTDLRTSEQILLYHFLDLKKDPSFHVPESFPEPSLGFFVSNKGVSPCDRPYSPRRKPISLAIAKLVGLAREVKHRLQDLRRHASERKNPESVDGEGGRANGH